MSCRKHPKYKAMRSPRVLCDDCWKMYELRVGKTEAIHKYVEVAHKLMLKGINKTFDKRRKAKA